MRLILAGLILLLITFNLSDAKKSRKSRKKLKPPKLCARIAIPYHGRDIMRDYRGKVVTLALHDLSCGEKCKYWINSVRNTVDEIETGGLRSNKLIIAAPQNESYGWINYYQRTKKKFEAVIQDNWRDAIWKRLMGMQGYLLIFDKCGRLNFYLHSGETSPLQNNVMISVEMVHTSPPCGNAPCRKEKGPNVWNYTTPPPPEPTTSTIQPTDWITETTTDTYSWRPDRFQRHTSPSYNPPTRYSTRYPQYTTTQSSYGLRFSTRSLYSYTTQSPYGAVQQTRRVYPARTAYPPRTVYPPMTVYPATRYPTRPPVYPEQYLEHTTRRPYDYEKRSPYYHATVQPVTDSGLGQTKQFKPTKSTKSLQVIRSTTSTIEPWYAIGFKDYSEYPEYSDVKTHLETNIQSSKSESGRPSYIHGTPCAQFTDHVCWQQQMEKGIGSLHPCCHRQFYLTNLCDSRTCTNESLAMCCFHKFLQARYICCHDKELTGSKIDEFSKCCYHQFIEPDPCCPAEEAAPYWNEKAELYFLCMPNVHANYSQVAFEISAKSSEKDEKSGEKRVLDLADYDDVLKYECPYGKKRDSFFYWQPPKVANLTSSN